MINFNKVSSLFTLWTVQGVIALVWLLLIPTDAGTYSASRFVLIFVLAAVSTGSAFLVYRSRFIEWEDVLASHSRLDKLFYLAALMAFIFPPLVLAALVALGHTLGITYTAYAERLSPLVFWVSLAGVEWCVWQMVGQKTDFSSFWPILRTALKILIPVGLVIAILLFTGWGISPVQDGSFGNPATPLLEWQIILAVFVGAAAILTQPYWQLKQPDKVLFILVYIIACFVWLMDPLIPGFFATPPRAPNFEPYPFSDPLIYAQYSQSALAGNGFLWPDIPTRPFYVMLLTWMYAIAGQNYYHVIILQIILLAFFPAALYLLGSELGSRPLGLMLAALAILRDLTVNHAAPFASNYSYSKLLLSELPTALFLVIFTILVIRWMKSQKPAWFFLLMGGVLGVASLIRLQSAVLLAPMAVLAVFPLWDQRRREWLVGTAVTTLGFVLVFSPWLVRNYHAADGLVLDNPISQSMTFARRWSGDNGNTILPQLSNETTAQYVSRMNEIAVESFKQEPDRILIGVVNHFFNNLISSLHTFPIRDRIESPSELIWPSHAFWQTGASSPILSAFYIIFLALGLAAAWISHRWVGLTPFVFSLAYNAWTAIFLSSGDRFLIPIDWTWHLYYALGLLTLVRLALSGIQDIRWPSNHKETQDSITIPTFHWKKTAVTAGLVLLTGISLPLTEFAFPEKYPPLTQEQLSASLGVVPTDGEVIVYGRAVYPRYYSAGDGEPATAKLGYEPSEQARLVFWLVGPDPGLVIFPHVTPPEFFPHTVDTWIIGRMDGDALRARIIKVKEGERTIIYGNDRHGKQSFEDKITLIETESAHR
jgi:hypothetical protein